MKINNIKKGILTGLAGLVLAGCSTFSIRPTGHIELAKVPMRIDDQVEEDEVMTDLQIGVQTTIEQGLLQDYIPSGILKGASLLIGGGQRTYMRPPLGQRTFYNPQRQEYDFFAELQHKNLTFFYFHMCSHPVLDEVEYWVTDIETRRRYKINHDSISKIGIRWEF